jgi:hypothetical protein
VQEVLKKSKRRWGSREAWNLRRCWTQQRRALEFEKLAKDEWIEARAFPRCRSRRKGCAGSVSRKEGQSRFGIWVREEGARLRSRRKSGDCWLMALRKESLQRM